jgi:hypothetical protein
MMIRVAAFFVVPLTFVRNHAQAIVACDFFVVVTATFRVLYVFVVIEIGTRRIVHCNVTAHPKGMDAAAIPRGHPRRAPVQFRHS